MKKLNLIAVIGILAVALGAATAQANLITNGSFEEGTPPGQYLTVNAGGTAITGWTVGSGGVDYIGSYWQAADGSRSVDLSGNAPGFVSQSFATTAGATYTVSFYLAGNPDNSADKTIRVTYGPNEDDFKDFTFTQAGHTKSNMGWVKEEFTFVGTGSLTTLQFASTTGTAFGAALDNVVVVPIPPSALLLGTGLLGIGLLGWRRRKTS